MESDEGLAERRLCGVDVAFRNPARAEDSHARRTVDNFGDLLGQLVVQLMLASAGLPMSDSGSASGRLLTGGSVVRYGSDGDVVWGAGTDGKMRGPTPGAASLDIRSVRGPWTAAELYTRGYRVPKVYGDPALLICRLMPDVPQFPRLDRLRLVVPNLKELDDFRERQQEFTRLGLRLLSPRTPLMVAMSAIAHAEFVVGSSLHAVALADSYGVPARLVRPAAEPEFEYVDYLLGSGRRGTVIAEDLEQAVELGGHEPPELDADALLDTYPWDMWYQEALPHTPSAGVFAAQPVAIAQWFDRVAEHKAVGEITDAFVAIARAALSARDASPETVGQLVDTRTLAVPDVSRNLLPPDVRPLAHAIDHGRAQGVSRTLERGGPDERAHLRARRQLGNKSLLSLDIELARAVGPSTTVELAAGRTETRPLQLFESSYGLVTLEIDALVEGALADAAEDLSVRITDEDGERYVPVDTADSTFPSATARSKP